MQLEVTPAKYEEKPIVENLLELYFYDLAEYAHEGWRDVSADGRFGYDYLDLYWSEPSRAAFLVRCNGQLAGFVLVNEHSILSKVPNTKSIAEFFMMKKYRRCGIGWQVAEFVLRRFPGPWEVAQDSPNLTAQEFWRAVVSAYTQGQFETTMVDDERWRGPVLSFSK
jgi:predicted acetyltransferase